MAGRPRKIPKEVQDIFDRNKVRRFTKEEAITLFKEEFSLSQDQAETMFDTFDVDKNGFMSMWEFQQFYTICGKGAPEMVEKFQSMDKDGSGQIDLAEAKEGLQSMGLGDKEIDFFIKTSKGDDEVIDIGEFCGLLYKLKMYEGQKKKKK